MRTVPGRLARLVVMLIVLLMACSAFFLVRPSGAWANTTLCSGANYSTCINAGYTDHGYGANNGTSYWQMYTGHNCTNYVAYVEQTVNGAPTPSYRLGNADTWYSNASTHGVTTNHTPDKGSVAWWGDAKWNGNSGHVAYVESVNSDGSITVSEDAYPNGPFDWMIISPGSSHWPGGFIHFKDLSSTVLAVKKLTQSDGTNEVFWAKSTDVFETWWRGSSGLNLANLIHISQSNIVDIDVALYPSGEHDLYTATTNWIYETWWYPGQALHTTAIINSPSKVRHIQKTIGPDGVTQQLYVLTDTGAYEYWWNSGSNGIQHGTIMTLANPVAMYKTLEPDGTQVLFVADQSYPYMLRWGGGLSSIQQTTFSYFSGITSISFSLDADGKNRLYVGQSSGQIWEASWYIGGPISYWPMAGGAPVVALQKWESDSTQVLYEATAGGVLEYWWPTGTTTLNRDTIVGGLSKVHAFVRSTDPGGVQSVYTTAGTNIFESWWIPGGDGVHTGQIE